MPTQRQQRGTVCVGQAVLDRVYAVDGMPTTATKVRALDMVEVGGGIAANAAVAVARLGGQVALWSRVGDDLAAQAIVCGLEAERVDVRHVLRSANARSSTSAAIVDAQGGDRLVVNDRGAGLRVDAGWLPLSALDAATMGCVLADVRWPEGSLAALKAARERNIATVLDADVGSQQLQLQLLVAFADHAIFAEEALAEFAGGGAALDTQDAAALRDALRRAQKTGALHAGVTLGARGYVWLDAAGAGHWQPAFRVEAIDTHGAGDAFHGAFAWALADGQTPARAARAAAAVAAISCTRPGGRAGLPTRAELELFLASAETIDASPSEFFEENA